jgi:hypothetical protein
MYYENETLYTKAKQTSGENKMKKISILSLLLIFSFLNVIKAEQITGDQIITNCIYNYQQQIKKTNNVKITLNNGMIYKRFINSNDKRITQVRNESEIMGQKILSLYDGEYQWQKNPLNGAVSKVKTDFNALEMIENLNKLKTKYQGEETLDGKKAYVLIIDDLGNLSAEIGKDKLKNSKGSGKLFIDPKNWLILKIELIMQGEDSKGNKRTVKNITEMKDYKKVKTLWIPYTTIIKIDTGLSPEEQAKIKTQISEARKQLDNMTGTQKEMFKKILEPQIAMLEKSLKDGITINSQVKNVEVNTKLSDDLFDGNKL